MVRKRLDAIRIERCFAHSAAKNDEFVIVLSESHGDLLPLPDRLNRRSELAP